MEKRYLTFFMMVVAFFQTCSTVLYAQETTTYSYDALGRLIASSTSGGTNDGVNTATTFDAAGNRSNYSVVGVATTPILAVGNASATEGSVIIFAISRSGVTTSAASVSYVSASGTAASGTDFTAVSGTVNFAAGETSKTVSVTTTNDTLVEANETFTITLSAPTGGAVIGTATGTGTINDNDASAVPSFAISTATSITEGGAAVFTVTKTGTVSTSFSVNFATSDGSAISGADYTANSGILTFAATEAIKTISIATVDDSAVESSETLSVTISSPTGGATITTAQGIATINDNDVTTPIAITDNNLVVLPAHQISYTCSVGSYMGASWAYCMLNDGSNTIVYNVASTPTLDPGYSMPVANRLEVLPAYYGTGVAP